MTVSVISKITWQVANIVAVVVVMHFVSSIHIMFKIYKQTFNNT